MEAHDHKPWIRKQKDLKIVRSVARTGPGCHNGCGVLLYVKDNKLVKVEGDPDYPYSKGFICPRCLALPQVVHHPQRLKYPLKRVGDRGAGKWQRISWDDAYELIVKRFNHIKQTHGPEAVLFCQGTGRDIIPYITKLAYAFGSPNVAVFGPLQGHACFAPKMTTLAVTTGDYVVADASQFFADRYQNVNWKPPEVLIIWGNNPIVSNPDGFMGQWVIECMKNGSKIIVVDPKRTWLAGRAKIHLQLRPGTDAALALGMLHIIIHEKLYDQNFVSRWVHGFKRLKQRVKEYPPELVSQITWVPKEKIIEAARSYAAAKPGAIQWGVAIDQSKECIPTIHAIEALWSVTGNLDIPGGNVIVGKNFGLDAHIEKTFATLEPGKEQKKVGWGKYPLLDRTYHPVVGSALLDHMLDKKPYPIKAAWIQTTNTFACGSADPKKAYQAFKKLDFITVVDLFMTPTAMALADLVLPAATYAERDGITILGGVGTNVAAINKALAPPGECKSDMQINLELGRRLSPEAWPWRNVQEMFDTMIAPSQMRFEELQKTGYVYDKFEYRKHEKGLLRKDNQPGFKTPSGKIELYSSFFESCGLDPLPYFEEPPESPISRPDLLEKYPLVLTTGAKTRGFFHSEHRQIPTLRRLNPDPLVEMHEETAHALGIKDGDWVIIENQHGRCRQKAKLSFDIHPKVASAQHGWWFPEQKGPEPNLFGVWQSNINLLLPSDWTGKSGFGYPFKCQMCRIYKEG